MSLTRRPIRKSLLQVRSRTSAWYVARRSPRAAIWSHTCASTRVTSRSSVASATRRSRGRSIYDDTGKDSIQQHRPSIIAPFSYPRSPPTSDNRRRRCNQPPVITWYLFLVTVEILSPASCPRPKLPRSQHRVPVTCFFSLFALARRTDERKERVEQSDCAGLQNGKFIREKRRRVSGLKMVSGRYPEVSHTCVQSVEKFKQFVGLNFVRFHWDVLEILEILSQKGSTHSPFVNFFFFWLLRSLCTNFIFWSWGKEIENSSGRLWISSRHPYICT